MINNKSYTPISIKILSQNHQETPQIMFKKTKIMKKKCSKNRHDPKNYSAKDHLCDLLPYSNR